MFTLRNTETTQPYQASTGGAFIQLFCEATKIFESDEKGPDGQRSFRLVLDGNSGTHSADLRLNQDRVSFSAYADTGFAAIGISNAITTFTRLPLLQIGNRNFTDVTVAIRDTAVEKKGGIYQLYYTQAEAVVGFAEYPSLKIWVKQ